MKLSNPKSNPKKARKPRKPKLAPPEKRVKTMLAMPPQTLKGPGFMIISSRGSTRWERFKNLMLFVWRYVWHGRAQL